MKIKTKNTTKKGPTIIHRSDTVRKLILNAKNVVDTGYIELAVLAYEVYIEEFYKKWGFTDFKEYAEREMDIKYRKLMYFVEIGNKVKELGLSKERLDKLGWSKLSLITGLLDKSNVDEWLDKAETMSTRQLAETVKITKRNDPNATIPKITTIKFRLSETIATTVLDALDTAKKLTGNDDQAVSLEMICSDWLETQDAVPERASLEHKIAYLEKVYNVTLVKAGGEHGEEKNEINAAKKEDISADADLSGLDELINGENDVSNNSVDSNKTETDKTEEDDNDGDSDLEALLEGV